MESMRDPAIIPLGAAQVSPGLLPIRQLNRRLAAIAREVQDVGGSYGDTTGLPTLRRQLQTQVERTRAAVAHSFPAGTRASAPAGGFVLWVELPPGVDAYTLQARALEHGISIAPGPIFSPRERYTNHIRLSCGFPWSDRTAQAIATVGTLASGLAARGR
jgi:DNA-binding transcriptional MocR family regulator